MTPPTPRLRPIPLPSVPGYPAQYPPGLPSPPALSTLDLNPILEPSALPKLYYDIAQPPSTAIFVGPYTPIMLAMYATTPRVTSFRIIVPTTPPWPVVVYNRSGVTVFDVLNALYRSLHMPVSPSIWDGLTLPRVVVPLPVALPVRAQSHTIHSSSASKPQGQRKVDQLQGRTMFGGLEKRDRYAEGWMLHTSA